MAASISGMGSSGLSSIYGNRPVISGLASGMDTESMIEQAVSGHKMKIESLMQMQTKATWEQNAFRNIINMMADFTAKYTSYSSSTNLLSSSFFSNALNIATQGKYADKISATGKPTSNVQILGVKQLATAATHQVKLGSASGTITSAGSGIDLNQNVDSSNLTGSLTLKHGSTTISLSFDDTVYKNPADFEKAINDQLKEKDPSTTIQARMDASGNLSFTDTAGGDVKITGASGKLGETVKGQIDSNKLGNSLSIQPKDMVSTKKLGETLAGKEFKLTVDGITKTIKIPESGNLSDASAVLDSIKTQVNKAFGNKVSLDASTAAGSNLKLSFTLKDSDGSTMEISGGKALGLSSDAETSYMNPNTTLGSLWSGNKGQSPFGTGAKKAAAVGKVTEAQDKNGKYHVDEKGNRVKQDTDGNYYRVDDKGAFQYELEINGEVVGAFSEHASIQSVMNAINGNEQAGVKVSFSKLTNSLQFEARETGSAGTINISGGLAEGLFGTAAAKGQDAIVTVTVNGEVKELERSSNTFDLEGLKVTLNDTFGEYGNDNTLDDIEAAKQDAVKFTSSTDTDKVINVVKEMVDDYNKLVTEIHKAYSTMPERKSNGAAYEPLTESQKKGMSESEIKDYEEKVKQGLLFGNRELSNLYNELTAALTPFGEDTGILRSIGIETAYKDGLTTIKLDEEKMRTALETEPEKVEKAFSKRKGDGTPTDGLMQTMQNVMDKYGSISGKKGILVEYAGSPRAASTLHNNVLQKKIDDYQKQIDRWTEKMTDQVDFYTRQFARLEQLVAQMNSQSQALAGMMGGMGG